ncbi:SDR family NAD(P)-dependent oxidoreductase, partial [Acinetobacter baumannii]
MTNTVFITGCSTGIGRTTAKILSEAGWNVAATLRDPEDSDLPFADHILVSRLDVEDKSSIESA